MRPYRVSYLTGPGDPPWHIETRRLLAWSAEDARRRVQILLDFQCANENTGRTSWWRWALRRFIPAGEASYMDR